MGRLPGGVPGVSRPYIDPSCYPSFDTVLERSRQRGSTQLTVVDRNNPGLPLTTDNYENKMNRCKSRPELQKTRNRREIHSHSAGQYYCTL